jgi:hypothetical protein
MARANKTEFDLDEYVRQSTAASGVPEKLEDPDTIRDVVTLLSSVRSSSAARRFGNRTATRGRSPYRATSAIRSGRAESRSSQPAA